jgi:hypothetical protein
MEARAVDGGAAVASASACRDADTPAAAALSVD